MPDGITDTSTATQLTRPAACTDRDEKSPIEDQPRGWKPAVAQEAGHEVQGFGYRLGGEDAIQRNDLDSGITSHAVAAALGHESFRTTAESYAQRDAVAGAQQKRVLGVLAGGKLASRVGANRSPIVP
jgi:hypothetical protein